MIHRILPAILAVSCAAVVFGAPGSGTTRLAEYRDYAAFRAEVDRLAASSAVTVDSLATTPEGRDVVVLTVGNGDVDAKPAILVLGSVEADDLTASHVALELVGSLAEVYNRRTREALPLDGVTVYVIPRPSPDASERLFSADAYAATVNTRPMDDDRDGEVDEDPAEDLNVDGHITQVRIEDPAGEWIVHPDEPRLMIKADPTKGEQGTHRLITEGIDSDGDEKWNEDGPGGVNFNRNFTFKYPYFSEGAGPHQVSEPSTRAVADFAYDHPNIFLVYTLGSQDNLNHPWKKGGDERIRTSPPGDDAAHLKRIAERYAEHFDPESPPDAAESDGAFAPWAYYHYGRWSIAAPVWWPTVDEEVEESEESEEVEESGESEESEESEEDDRSTATPEASASAEVSKSEASEDDAKGEDDEDDKPDDRAKAQRTRLAWLDASAVGGRGFEGFIDWTEISHPDFPDMKAEVGGFVPGVALHPPVDELSAEPHMALLEDIAAMRPQVAILSADAKPLGEGVYRVTTTIRNRGDLPTASAMGERSRQLRRSIVALESSAPLEVLTGPRRQDVKVLAPGEAEEKTWLVRSPSDATLTLRVGEPSVGFDEKQIDLNSN